MSKIPESYNFGDRSKIDPDNLLEILDDMYQILAIAINQKPSIFCRNIQGDSTDADANDSFVSV